METWSKVKREKITASARPLDSDVKMGGMSKATLILTLAVFLSACSPTSASNQFYPTPAPYNAISNKGADPAVEAARFDALSTEQASGQARELAATRAAETATALPPQLTAAWATAIIAESGAIATSTTIAKVAQAENKISTATAEAQATAWHIAGVKTEIAVTQMIGNVTQTATAQAAAFKRTEERADAGFWFLVALAGLVILGLGTIAWAVSNRIDTEARARSDAIKREGAAKEKAIEREAESNAEVALIVATAKAEAERMRAAVFAHRDALVNAETGAVLYESPVPTRIIEHSPIAAQPAQPPRVNTVRESYPLLADPQKQELLKFLQRCLRYAGKDSTTIPRYDSLRMGAGRRQVYVRLLEQAGLVQAKGGDETLVIGYNNLGELVQAFESGAVSTVPATVPA